MKQNERMLRFIRGYDVVDETALKNKFGDSYPATMQSLKRDGYIKLKTKFLSGPNVVGHISIPNTWHITSAGEEWLKDMEAERAEKRRADWWARGLAIAAIVISLIALLKE